jgi:polysaccharide biosynthesis/export protein
MPRASLIIAPILLAGAACLAFAGYLTISGAAPGAGDVVGQAGTGATPSYELVDIDSYWEAAVDGLFSAPLVADRFTTGSKSATISEQVVGRDGAITVPYAGRIPVAGADDQSRADHRRTCAPSKAIQPQVLVAREMFVKYVREMLMHRYG